MNSDMYLENLRCPGKIRENSQLGLSFMTFFKVRLHNEVKHVIVRPLHSLQLGIALQEKRFAPGMNFLTFLKFSGINLRLTGKISKLFQNSVHDLKQI